MSQALHTFGLASVQTNTSLSDRPHQRLVQKLVHAHERLFAPRPQTLVPDLPAIRPRRPRCQIENNLSGKFFF